MLTEKNKEVVSALAEIEAMRARQKKAKFYAAFSLGGAAFSSVIALVATVTGVLRTAISVFSFFLLIIRSAISRPPKSEKA